MIICSCHALSDQDVHRANAAHDHALSADQLHPCFGCQVKCGRCVTTIQRILAKSPTNPGMRHENRLSQLCHNADATVDSAQESMDYLSFARKLTVEMA